MGDHRWRSLKAPGAAGVLLLAASLGWALDENIQQIDRDARSGNWGLDRIDQARGYDGAFRYRTTGAGVSIYIVDTGVLATHQDLPGRVTYVGDFCTGSLRTGSYETYDDGYDGHGTHVASYAAGAKYGVAKGARLYALRVQAPSAPNRASDAREAPLCGDYHNAAAVTAAVEWITANASAPAVVNISFVFRPEDNGRREMFDAIHRSIEHGFVYALSAGSGGSVESHWGAVIPAEALVVAGTDEGDRALGTGYGPGLSLFAPAKGLYGAGRGEGEGTRGDVTIPEACCGNSAGDSFAAPFVAGAAALYLEVHPQATPRAVRAALLELATAGVVSNTGAGSGAAPNRLLRVP